MNGVKTDIDPTTELLEEDEDQSLPELEADAGTAAAASSSPLAAGRAAIARHVRLAPSMPAPGKTSFAPVSAQE